MLAIVFLAILLILCIFVIYKFVYAPLQLFRNVGINGPTPLPLVGNFLLRHKLGFIKFHDYLFKKYGPVVGYYNGHMPFLCVTDADMLKQILVKDFDTFMDRPYVPQLTRAATTPKGLFSSQGQEWKTARQIISPSFSSAKLKAMMPHIERSAENLVKCFGQSADSAKSVNVGLLYGHFTLETILATAFGCAVDVQGGESTQLVEAAHNIFRLCEERSSVPLTTLIPLLGSFPNLESIIRFLLSFTKIAKYSQVLFAVSKLLIQKRRQNSKHNYNDLLQFMMNACHTQVKRELDPTLSYKQCNGHAGAFTDDQIVAHSVTFLLAGYETTSTALSYISYMLALNPTVQEKLQNDIDSFFNDNPESSLYDAAQQIGYLNKVIFETLRLHKPAPSILRHCRKSVVINGVNIPKGVTIEVPIHLLHKNPKYWKDPEVFDPERFSPEEKAKRPQLSYLPFGFGPRTCIGMRFALIEAKVALILFLKKYTFVKAPDTEVPLETVYGLTITPKHGVYLQIATRHDKKQDNDQ